jgi:hypothetical protein
LVQLLVTPFTALILEIVRYRFIINDIIKFIRERKCNDNVIISDIADNIQQNNDNRTNNNNNDNRTNNNNINCENQIGCHNIQTETNTVSLRQEGGRESSRSGYNHGKRLRLNQRRTNVRQNIVNTRRTDNDVINNIINDFRCCDGTPVICFEGQCCVNHGGVC